MGVNRGSHIIRKPAILVDGNRPILLSFNMGPYQYQLKHLKWYLDTQTHHLTGNTVYRHWLTTKNVVAALSKEADWVGQLQGAWTSPKSTGKEKI